MPPLPVPPSTPARAGGTSADLAAHLPALRAALLQQRRFRSEQIGQLSAAVPTGAATDARDQVALTLRRAAQVALADIDAALARMDRDRYGRCVRCDTAIPLERLEILPAVALCMSCQRDTSDR